MSSNEQGKPNRKQQRKQKRQAIRDTVRGVRRNNRPDNFRDVPIAQARRYTASSLSWKPKGSQSLSLSGTDMFQLPSDNKRELHMTFSLPANPVHWKSTRISSIAQVYQKYKPIAIRIRYVPNCPATSSGSITMGFVEQEVTFQDDNAVMTILNGGGKNINIYQTDSIVFKPKLKDDLFTNGQLTQVTSNPFTFYLYSVRQEDIPPGILYVDWHYEFKLGSGNQQIPIESKESTTPDTLQTLMRHGVLSDSNALSIGWGVAVGWLKTTGVKLLRNISILVCETILASLTDNARSNAITAHTVQINAGQYCSIDPSDVYSDTRGVTRVKTNDGSDYYIPDQSRVVIYMNGPAVSAPVVTSQRISLSPGYKVHGAVLEKRDTMYYAEIKLVKINFPNDYINAQIMFDADKRFLSLVSDPREKDCPVHKMDVNLDLYDGNIYHPLTVWLITFVEASTTENLNGMGTWFCNTNASVPEAWIDGTEFWKLVYDAAADKAPWN